MSQLRLLCWTLAAIVLTLSLFPSALSAQACSVRSSAAGECTDSLVLTWRVGSDEPSQNILTGHSLEALWPLPTAAPIRVSRLEPLSSHRPSLSYLNIQRLLSAHVAGGSIEPQLIWDFGTVAQLEARLQDIGALLRALLESFFKSQDQGTPPSARELTLMFNLDSPNVFLPAQIESLSSFGLDERLRLYLSRATVTLRTAVGPGSLTGEIELDPKNLDISKEKIGLELSLGTASLSGATTFEQGVGLTSQIYAIRAQVGHVQLIGQATFTATWQEFKIGASICGLAFSGSSVITQSGVTEQRFFFETPLGGSSSCK